MNLSVLLVCFTFFSFRVSLSSATDAVFIAPVLFLAIFYHINITISMNNILFKTKYFYNLSRLKPRSLRGVRACKADICKVEFDHTFWEAGFL